MSTITDQLSAALPVAIRSLAKRLGQAFEEKGMDVMPAQMGLLHYLSKNQDPVQTALAHHMDKDKSAILRQVDILEQNGWIERQMDPNDRRRKHLVVSKSGMEVLKKALKLKDKVIADLSEGIPEKDLATCVKVLERLGRNATGSLK